MNQPPDLVHEKQIWSAYPMIAGLDEAGRGALAGPVCVGAVILPNDDAHLSQTLSLIRDSKQLTPQKRSLLTPIIKHSARAWAVGFSSAVEIDSLGIAPAARLAACRAIASLTSAPQYLLTDFRLELPELDLPQTSLVKGDQLSLSIAAASILAKTARDQYMIDLHKQFPKYEFTKHKGYGTIAHRKAISKFGRSKVHRKSFIFKPV